MACAPSIANDLEPSAGAAADQTHDERLFPARDKIAIGDATAAAPLTADVGGYNLWLTQPGDTVWGSLFRQADLPYRDPAQNGKREMLLKVRRGISRDGTPAPALDQADAPVLVFCDAARRIVQVNRPTAPSDEIYFPHLASGVLLALPRRRREKLAPQDKRPSDLSVYLSETVSFTTSFDPYRFEHGTIPTKNLYVAEGPDVRDEGDAQDAAIRAMAESQTGRVVGAKQKAIWREDRRGAGARFFVVNEFEIEVVAKAHSTGSYALDPVTADPKTAGGKDKTPADQAAEALKKCQTQLAAEVAKRSAQGVLARNCEPDPDQAFPTRFRPTVWTPSI
jgi:hypothetical protein